MLAKFNLDTLISLRNNLISAFLSSLAEQKPVFPNCTVAPFSDWLKVDSQAVQSQQLSVPSLAVLVELLVENHASFPAYPVLDRLSQKA